jgi:DNA-binding transcriptional LysR family regulator
MASAAGFAVNRSFGTKARPGCHARRRGLRLPAVEQGLGIGHPPCFIVGARPGLVRFGPLVPDSRPTFAFSRIPTCALASVRVFLDFLAAEVTKQRKLSKGAYTVQKADA